MFCTNCGREIEDDAVFCTSCGTKCAAAPEPEKKTASAKKRVIPTSKKAWMIYGAAALAVACILLVGAIAGNQPKAVVLRGLSKTWKSIKTEETGAAGYVGLSKLEKAVREGNTKQSISLNISDGAASGGISGEVRKNKDHTILIDGEILVGNMSLLDASLYRDKAKTVATVPKLYQKSFALDHMQLKEKLKSTAFIAQMNSTLGTQLGKIDMDSLKSPEEYRRQLLVDGKLILKNMKVKKLPKREFTIYGKNKNCKGYQITIQKADIKNMGQNYANMVIEDSVLMNWLGEGQRAPEMVRQELKQEMKQILAGVTEDLIFNVYIGSKNRVVFMESEYPFVHQNGVTSAKASLTLKGRKNPADNMELQVEAQETGGYYEQYTFIRTLDDGVDKIKDVLEINATRGRYFDSSSSPYSNNASIALDLDKKRNSWVVDIGVIGSGGNEYASIEGTLDDLVRGERAFITVDSVRAGTYGYGGQQPDILIQYGIEPLDHTIEAPPADEQENLLELTGADMNRIGMEMQKNIYNSGIERAFEASIFY